MKIQYIRALFKVAFLKPFRPVLYTRSVGRYPYQHTPAQMIKLREFLLSVNAPGAYLEVGAAEGNTTCWLGQSMQEACCLRRMFVIDTFSGFTAADKAAEYQRGKERGLYDSYFLNNSQKWFDESMKRASLDVLSFAGDCSTFDYSQLGSIAFALLDVDLYRPVTLALPGIYAQMAQGGMIVEDDCDPQNQLWDGADQAYREFCLQHGIKPEVVAGKFGIIRK
jgi:hypothetical protein